ncbi:MAG: DUF192 domain-containing protein [Patescibacteria group bacterium]
MKIENYKLKIGDKTILVEIADTTEKLARGLSGRKSLSPGSGMLFVFSEIGSYGFWMKDMKFPIDIAWLERIDNSFRIVGIERNVSPESFPHVFYPPVPIKYVVETNAGEL